MITNSPISIKMLKKTNLSNLLSITFPDMIPSQNICMDYPSIYINHQAEEGLEGNNEPWIDFNFLQFCVMLLLELVSK